jgi:hypothetical protein
MATLNSNRNKKSNYKYKDIVFDSLEEIEFYLFLRDCLKYKLIKSFIYQPESLELIPKATLTYKQPYKRKAGYKEIEKTLYSAHKYTPDFKFKPLPLFWMIFPQAYKILRYSDIDKHYYIDVKGAYNRFGGDRQFSLNQKLAYQKFQIHINKIIPEKFFQQIGAAPDEIRWMKSRKVPTLKKAYIGVQSIEEKINSKTNNQDNIIEIENEEINVSFLKSVKHKKVKE